MWSAARLVTDINWDTPMADIYEKIVKYATLKMKTKEWKKDGKIWVLTMREMTVRETMQTLDDGAADIRGHLHRSAAQYRAQRTLTNALLQPGEVILWMDFAENLTLRMDQEVQSAHSLAGNAADSAPGHVLRGRGRNIIVCGTERRRQPFPCHGPGGHTRLMIDDLRKTWEVKKVIRFTDGCAAQYKSRNTVADMPYTYSRRRRQKWSTTSSRAGTAKVPSSMG